MNVAGESLKEQQKSIGFDTEKIEQLKRVVHVVPSVDCTQPPLSVKPILVTKKNARAIMKRSDVTVLTTMKDACCCPDCGGWRNPGGPVPNHPCPPGSWYDDDNPYR